MTARAEYTAEEWVLLLVAPQAAVGAVVFADGVNLFEAVGEAVMAAIAQARGKERFPGNELITALIDNKERMDPARLPQPQAVGEIAEDVRQRLRTLAVAKCREVMVLLAERSNPAEAAGYAAWVMEIARTAATTVRHRDGLFGERGPVVDAEERTMLGEIAEALGVPVGDLPVERDIRSAATAPRSLSAVPAVSTGRIPAPDTVRAPGEGEGPDIPSGPIDPS